MKTPTVKSVVPVFWFRVAVASQLFMEGAAGYLLFSFLREISVKLEPADADSILGALSLLETGYFALGALFLVFCCFFAKPPTEDGFGKTKWWMAWAMLHIPTRTVGPSAGDDGVPSSRTGTTMPLNPSTGLPMVDGTMLDMGGNVFGSSMGIGGSGDSLGSSFGGSDTNSFI